MNVQEKRKPLNLKEKGWILNKSSNTPPLLHFLVTRKNIGYCMHGLENHKCIAITFTEFMYCWCKHKFYKTINFINQDHWKKFRLSIAISAALLQLLSVPNNSTNIAYVAFRSADFMNIFERIWRFETLIREEYTVFIRLSAQGAYLIFGLSGWALIRGRRLFEVGFLIEWILYTWWNIFLPVSQCKKKCKAGECCRIFWYWYKCFPQKGLGQPCRRNPPAVSVQDTSFPAKQEKKNTEHNGC